MDMITWTRLARTPARKTLVDFDFNAQPGVDRKVIHNLVTLAFIDRMDNICLLGPPGVGKSHLAIGLAITTSLSGYTKSNYPAGTQTGLVPWGRLGRHQNRLSRRRNQENVRSIPVCFSFTLQPPYLRAALPG